MTICKQCSNFINLDVDTPRRDVWYNHLCAAVPSETRIDPLDGVEKPYGTNHWFKHCRSVNKGNCSHFEKNIE